MANIDIPFLTDTIPHIAVELEIQTSRRPRTIPTSLTSPIDGLEEQNSVNQVVDPVLVSSTISSAAPPFLGSQTSWSRQPLAQTRSIESVYSLPDSKKFVEEPRLEINDRTNVPMSLTKRRRVNPSNVVEEPMFSFAQASFDGDQGRMTSMNDTKFL